jgi:hypothetical protein
VFQLMVHWCHSFWEKYHGSRRMQWNKKILHFLADRKQREGRGLGTQYNLQRCTHRVLLPQLGLMSRGLHSLPK